LLEIGEYNKKIALEKINKNFDTAFFSESFIEYSNELLETLYSNKIISSPIEFKKEFSESLKLLITGLFTIFEKPHPILP
jgi:hypothetical protein